MKLECLLELASGKVRRCTHVLSIESMSPCEELIIGQNQPITQLSLVMPCWFEDVARTHGSCRSACTAIGQGFISSLHDNALWASANVSLGGTIPGGRERESGGPRGLAPESELKATLEVMTSLGGNLLGASRAAHCSLFSRANRLASLACHPEPELPDFALPSAGCAGIR